jgi:heavy metal sensor kinase
MRIGKTLRARFAMWVAALLLVTLAAVGLLVYGAMSHSLWSAIDTELRLRAEQASAATDIEKDGGELELFDGISVPEIRASMEERGVTLRLLAPDGALLDAVGPLRALPARDADLAAARSGQAVFSTASYHGQDVRVYTIPVVDGKRTGIVQSAQSLAEMQSTLGQLLTAMLISVPLIVVVAGLGGYILAARALAPITAITRAAQRISAEDLHARLNLPPTADEVGLLAGTFDGMIARLEGAFQRERQFTSDASHELRTPLAAMQLILSVTRAEPRTPRVYEQALDDLAAETSRLRGLVEGLLALARGASQWQADAEELDLATLLQDVGDTLRPMAEAKGLALICSAQEPINLVADRDALVRLFINLIDNGVKFTERGSICICAEMANGAATVIISDTGVGITESHLPQLFDRFYQGDASRRGRGAGLGLAIAKEIAEAHGGSIAVQSTVGVGSSFIVRLPAC